MVSPIVGRFPTSIKATHIVLPPLPTGSSQPFTETPLGADLRIFQVGNLPSYWAFLEGDLGQTHSYFPLVQSNSQRRSPSHPSLCSQNEARHRTLTGTARHSTPNGAECAYSPAVHQQMWVGKASPAKVVARWEGA